MINQDALIARVIHIDSRLRKSGRAEDCVIELNEPIHLPPGAVCWCSAITLPFSWTNVSTLNNTLHFTERTLVGTAAAQRECEVTIPSKEYTRSGLKDALWTAFAMHMLTNSILPMAVTYDVDSSVTSELRIRLFWNGQMDRYDFTGLYKVDSNSANVVSVFRDYRNYTDPTMQVRVCGISFLSMGIAHWHCHRRRCELH